MLTSFWFGLFMLTLFWFRFVHADVIHISFFINTNFINTFRLKKTLKHIVVLLVAISVYFPGSGPRMGVFIRNKVCITNGIFFTFFLK